MQQFPHIHTNRIALFPKITHPPALEIKWQTKVSNATHTLCTSNYVNLIGVSAGIGPRNDDYKLIHYRNVCEVFKWGLLLKRISIMILFLSASWRTKSRFAQKPCRVLTFHNTTRFTANASFYCSVAEGKHFLKNGMIDRHQCVVLYNHINLLFICSCLCCYLDVQRTLLTSFSGILMWIACFSLGFIFILFLN